MIKAFLNGKVHQVLNAEDSLTSIVFERIEYLSEERLLFKFLQKSKSVNYEDNSEIYLNEYLLGKYNSALDNYSKFKIFYWPKHRKQGEPDLIIILFNDIFDDGILLLIEAKFLHGKSRFGENDQLLSYYRAINFQLDEFYDENIANFKGIIGPLIYLTTKNSDFEIEESEKLIGNKNSIFSLKWDSLYTELSRSIENKITKNLSDYLSYLTFTEFKGFSVNLDISEYQNIKWFKEVNDD